MTLAEFWFFLVAYLFAGYFLLEGFDFGVGMLLPVLGKDDVDKRVMINTIGPVWDANETWVIAAGASIFAAYSLSLRNRRASTTTNAGEL